MRRSILVIALGAFLPLSCGSDDSAQGGQGGNIGQKGCTSAPDCNACQGCWSLCLCTTGDTVNCQTACGVAGSSGQGGQGGTGAAGGASGTAGTAGGSGGGPTTLPPAPGLRITDVSVYQSTKIPIMRNGADIGQRNSPVVADRPALVRVFVTPDPAWQPRDVVCRLDLSNGQKQEIPKFIGGPSVEEDLQSAFNFDIPAEQFKGDLAYIATLLEANPNAGIQGDTSGTRWPVQGGSNFGALSANGTFKVVVVPLVVNGITPDTSQGRMQAYQDEIFSRYPIPGVEINVRAPVPYGNNVDPGGSGWSGLLNTLLSVRLGDNVPGSVYYYGVVTPASSIGGYCGGGCVAGLGPVPQAQDNEGRGAVGLGYFPSGGGGGSLSSPETMVHELGHALGRPHAPCQTNDAPPSFPYPGGSIGNWGYDLLDKSLKQPGIYTDMMGYCNPTWISDYNYDRLFQRISFVNASAYVVPPPDRKPGRYRSVVFETDGAVVWGKSFDLRSAPLGDKREIVTLDRGGQPAGKLTGYYYPFSEEGAGMMLVEEPPLKLVHSIKPVAGASFRLAVQ